MLEAATDHAYLADLKLLLDRTPMAVVSQVVERLARAAELGQRVFILGNGGSAATASHFACDLGKGTTVSAPRRFKVIALTDNVPLLTAWANDADYQFVFAEQLQNLVEPGDVVIAISASGKSPNVLRAIEVADTAGADTIGFTGGEGGPLREMVDFPVHFPGGTTEQIEDAHLVLQHLICTDLRARYANGRAVS
ncbi:MAG: SIS domain-containing protein [Nitrolancea sp.]